MEVYHHSDLDKIGMDDAIDSLEARLREIGRADSVIFYFAGHGFQDDGTNYLLPILAEGDESDSVNLQEVIDRLTNYSQRRLVFLDACRSYFDSEPIEDTLMRARSLSATQRPEIRKGLADFGAADETFISFSAAPGEAAYDGIDGRSNSPYAEALARFINEVDLPLSVMMARVRNSVWHDTGEKQKTWDSSSLKASYFFNPSSLLFLIGNFLALVAFFVALVSTGFVIYEAAVADYTKGIGRWSRVGVSVAILVLSITIFLFGVSRAYSRVRGEDSVWQAEGEFRLFKRSSAGTFGAIGGVLGGIIVPALIMLPYWNQWRNDKGKAWIAGGNCDGRHWAMPFEPGVWRSPFLSETYKDFVYEKNPCPELGLLFAEGAVAGIFILGIFGFFSLHFGEWMTRGIPSVFFKGRRWVLLIAGSTLGALLAAVIVGPPITAYFGSYDRPFVEPGFVIVWAIVSVALMSFCVVNYSLETFTPKRLLRSFGGALLGTVCGGAVLAALVGFLYWIEFIQFVLNWANNGFYDNDNVGYSTFWRYSFLAQAGLVYAIVFGVGFGVLIGVTRLVTETASKDANDSVSS